MSTLITNKKSKHIIRGDSATSWASSNPILLKNELAYDETNKKFKMGDGVTPWNSLPYVENGSSDAVELEPIKIEGYADFENGEYELTFTDLNYQQVVQNKTAPILIDDDIYYPYWYYGEQEDGGIYIYYRNLELTHGEVIAIYWLPNEETYVDDFMLQTSGDGSSSSDSIEFTTGGVDITPGSFLVDLTLTEEHYQLFLKNKSAPLVIPSMYYDGDDVWVTDESVKYIFTPVTCEMHYSTDSDKPYYYVSYTYFDGARVYDIDVHWGDDNEYYVDDYYEEHITENRHPIGISGYVNFVEGTADLNLSEACRYVMQDKTLPITIGSIAPNVPSGIIYYPYEWSHNDNGFLIAYRNIELTYVEIIAILWNPYDVSECIVDEVRYEELPIDNSSSGTSNKVIIPLTHLNSTTVSLVPEEYSKIIKETEHPEDIIIKLYVPDYPYHIYIPFSVLADGPDYRFYTYNPYYGEFLIELSPYTGNVSYYSAYTNTDVAPGVITLSGEVDGWGENFWITDFDIPASAYNQFKSDFSKPIKVGGHCFQVEYIDFYSGEEALVTYYNIAAEYIHRIVIYWTSEGGAVDEMYAEPLVSGGGTGGSDSANKQVIEINDLDDLSAQFTDLHNNPYAYLQFDGKIWTPVEVNIENLTRTYFTITDDAYYSIININLESERGQYLVENAPLGGSDSSGESSGGSSGTAENVVDLTSLGLIPFSDAPETGNLSQEQFDAIKTADKIILGSTGELETYLPLCNKTLVAYERFIYLFAGYGTTDSSPRHVTFTVYPDMSYAYMTCEVY